MFHRHAIRGAAAAAILSLVGLPLRAEPWPVDNVNELHRLANTYGQYQELGGLHFHEGIDIPVAAGTQVKAIKAGTIVNIVTDAMNPYNQYVTIEDIDAEHVGWGYVHVNIAAGIALNNQVAVGDVIGTVVAYPGVGFPTHLHLERDNDNNGGWPGFSPGAGTEHLADNPLLYVTPYAAQDFVGPFTSDNIRYRRAEDEGNDAGPLYMTSTSVGGREVVGSRAPNGSGNIDVIADSYDRVGAFADRLGIREIRVDAQGRVSVGNDQIPANQTLVNFVGDGFLPNANNFADFRNVNLTQVIYENDSVANSEQFGPYYHILTNQGAGGDAIVLGDRDYFWDTDGARGQPWNDNNAADRAANNAISAFRDDIYQINARAFDAASNVGTGVEHVILDNWLQTVMPDKMQYNLGETVAAAGDQYLPTDSVPLYVIENNPFAGGAIAAFGILASVLSNATDANGLMPISDIWSASMRGSYFVFADYDHDGIYIPELDAFAPFSVVPEPSILALWIAALVFSAVGPRWRRPAVAA